MIIDGVTVWTIRAIAAHATLGTLLAASTGRDPADLSYEFGPTGKPLLSGGPHFSLAHSDAWAVIAVCESAAVGVDIEAIPGPGGFETPARWAFTAREQRLLAQLPAEGRAEGFCRIWVVKEACAKQDGRGVPLMPLVETYGAHDTHGAHDTRAVAQSEELEWTVRIWSPCPGYHAAVALPGQRDFDLTLSEFEGAHDVMKPRWTRSIAPTRPKAAS